MYRIKYRHALTLSSSILAIAFLALTPHASVANPKGGQVVGGSATISENGKKLDVHQHTNRAVIDWRRFNIEVDEHTEFHQPSSGSIALNRVKSVDPSYIAGKLTANGNIILINPNGVFFEGTSQVDVNGIVATTADIKTQDFMTGSNHLNIPGNPNARIVNEGQITAKEAGLVGLVAPHVENHGVIRAKMGRVQLVSGDTVTVDFYGDDLLKVEVQDENVKEQLVVNTGTLSANGGTVAMTAAAAQKTIDSLIIADGTIEAKSIGRDKSGTIIIGGDGSNKTEKNGASHVIVAGHLDASGRNEGEQGGSIEVLGDHIALTDYSVIDASGYEAPTPARKPNTGTATMRKDNTIDNGVRTEEDFLVQDSRAGGSIKIGGDYLGKGDTQTAKTVSVAENAYILNEAIHEGDAGRTIVWSDDKTDFAGNVFARGGLEGGHGGFLETSGKKNLRATGFADLSYRHDGYQKGTYLLDPADITIYGNFDPTFASTDASIDLSTNLQLWLDGSDIDGDGSSEGAAESGLASGVGNCGAAITCVSQWSDKSGLGNHVLQGTAANRPELLLASQNGLDVIQFDGVNDYLDGGDILDLRTNDQSTFSAFKLNALSNGSIYAKSFFAATDARYSLLYESGNMTSLLDIGPVDNASTAFASTNYTTSSVIIERGGLNELYLNGSLEDTEIATADFTDQDGVNHFFVGAYNNAAGTGAQAGFYLDGNVTEIISYDDNLSSDNQNLIEQYQAAKWGIALDPLAGAGTEADEAMSSTAKGDASDGYGVFTAGYLERLSASANIVLQADNSITLDLQGDILALDNDRSISLTTTNGDITDVSAGTIRTTRTGTGGNISITAGGAGDITLDTTELEALSGGLVNLNAGGDVNITQTSDLSLGTVLGTNVNVDTTGAIDGLGALITTGGDIDVTAGTDIDFTTIGLVSAGGDIILDAGDDIAISTSVNAGTGSVNATAGQDITLVSSATPAISGLVGYWGFEEGAGGTAGDSLGSNDGTLVDNATWSTNTAFGLGSSVSFDGAGDYINISNDAAFSPATDITVSAWIYSGDWSGQNHSMIVAKGINEEWILWKSDDPGHDETVGFRIGSAGVANSAYATTILQDNQWYHVTGTYDGTDVKIYVDGQLDGQQGRAGFIPNGGNDPVRIGAGDNPANLHLDGLVDDVRIYNEALSDANVALIASSYAMVDTNWNSGTTTFNAIGDVTLNDTLTANDTGNALNISTGGSFVNNVGASVLNTTNPGARWLIYSPDPTALTLNGLTESFERYGTTIGANPPASIAQAGNGLLYSLVINTPGNGSDSSASTSNELGSTQREINVLPGRTIQTAQSTFTGGDDVFDIEVIDENGVSLRNNETANRNASFDERVKLKIERELLNIINLEIEGSEI